VTTNLGTCRGLLTGHGWWLLTV